MRSEVGLIVLAHNLLTLVDEEREAKVQPAEVAVNSEPSRT